jgi:hypothetical protein
MKKVITATYILVLFSLFSFSLVKAVTVSCGHSVGLGDYSFSNFDSGNVQVTISAGSSNVNIQPNNFTISAGQNQIVSFRSQTNSYVRLLVTYKELYGAGFSASLECPFYATTSGGSYTTTTTTTIATTTTIPSCSGLSYSTCTSLPNCVWVGSQLTGHCESQSSVTSTTTTTTAQTTTSTTTVTTNPTTTISQSNSGNSGSSGSSSGKSTGFYDFSPSVQAGVGEGKAIKGSFYNKNGIQTNVQFKVTGIDNNWFIISPSSVNSISSGGTVNITINLNIPDGASPDTYIFQISTKIGSADYAKSISLAVTPKETTVATTTETTALTTINVNETEGQLNTKPSIQTGFFVQSMNVIRTFWYVPVIVVALVASWRFLPNVLSNSKGTAYIKPEKEKKYVTVKIVEPKIEAKKETTPQIAKKSHENLQAVREKVIDEMRKRAMEEEKRFRK